jgi:hypothetical protein
MGENYWRDWWSARRKANEAKEARRDSSLAPAESVAE